MGPLLLAGRHMHFHNATMAWYPAETSVPYRSIARGGS